MLRRFVTVLALVALFSGCKGKTTGTGNHPGDDFTPPGDTVSGDTGPSNAAPVAVITPAPSVEIRKATTQALDGSASTDADGTIVGYAWTLPAGYAATDLGLTTGDLTSATITVTAPASVPADPNLVFTLTVTDDDGATDSESVTVIVVDNEAPVAVITPAPPREVREGSDLTLDASGSTDDISIASFAWTLPGGYTTTDLGIDPADLTTATLTFTAPSVTTDTELTFVLTLTDNEGKTTVVNVVVTVIANLAPVAVIDPAGPLTLGRNVLVQLNGSPSYDTDGSIASYAWTLPATYVAADFGLVAGDLTHAGIVPKMPNTLPASALVFTLTVTDNDGDQGQTTVSLTVANGAPVVRLFGDENLVRHITVARNDWTTLDFSQSSDPDGDALAFTFGGQVGTSGTCAGGSDFNFNEGASAASFWIPYSVSPVRPQTAACQGDGPFTLTAAVSDGLLSSSTMNINVSVVNSPPEVHVTGPVVVAAGGSGTMVGNNATNPTADPDPGDTLTYAWTVHGASDPTANCASDWGVTTTDQITVTFIAPTSATNPECAEAAVFVLTATDNHGASGASGATVVVAAGPHHLSASDVTVAAGHQVSNGAQVTPVLLASDTFVYTWTSSSVLSGSCLPGDLTITHAGDTAAVSTGALTVANNKAGCVFLVTVSLDINNSAEIVTTAFLVTATNQAPVINVVNIPEVSLGNFEITFPPGVTPTLTAHVFDPDSASTTDPLAYSWTGSMSAVTCSPAACAGSLTSADPYSRAKLSLTFASPTVAATTYTFNLQIDDGQATATVVIVVHVEPCLYVGKTVANPSAELGTLANPYATIQAAIDDAISRANTNVCVTAGTYSEDVRVRASGTNTPTISGGYNPTTGALVVVSREAASIIETIDEDGVTFEAGATNRLEFLTFKQAPALFAPGRAAAITITDASPVLANVVVTGGVGDPAIAVDIVAALADADPTLSWSTVTGSSRALAVDVDAVRVSAAAGVHAVPIISDSKIYVGAGTGHGAGIAVEAGAEALVSSTGVWDSSTSCGFADVAGIDVRGTPTRSATALVADCAIQVYTANSATEAFGIRLSHTDGVEVTTTTIGGDVGTRAGFGIADGDVFVDGSTVAGASQNLSIHDNPQIRGMGQWAGSGCSGTRFGVGVLLVGTSDVNIVDNPGTGGGGGFAGIMGGMANFAVDWATDRLPPTVAGLWLIDADDVTVLHNNILSGGLTANKLCPVPSPFPVSNALLDGMPAGLGHAPARATDGLLVDRNLVQCTTGNQDSGGGPGGTQTSCIAADMQGALDATLTNNILASYNANINIGLRLSGGTSLTVTNNLLDSDLFVNSRLPPVPNTIWKYALVADHVGTGALTLHNNILHVHQDDPYDNVNERLAVLELVTSGTQSKIAVLDHELMFIDGDLVSTPGVPTYVRILPDAAAAANHPANAVNSIPGVGVCTSNLVADPMLTGDEDQWAGKGGVRLGPGSPAEDAGNSSIAPNHDIDNEPRVAPVDIGADEIPG